jgi:signal transduction histidine kinase
MINFSPFSNTVYIIHILLLSLCIIIVLRYFNFWIKNIRVYASILMLLTGLIAITSSHVYIVSVDKILSYSEGYIIFGKNNVMNYDLYRVWVEGVHVVVTLSGMISLFAALILMLNTDKRGSS